MSPSEGRECRDSDSAVERGSDCRLVFGGDHRGPSTIIFTDLRYRRVLASFSRVGPAKMLLVCPWRAMAALQS